MIRSRDLHSSFFKPYRQVVHGTGYRNGSPSFDQFPFSSETEAGLTLWKDGSHFIDTLIEDWTDQDLFSAHEAVGSPIIIPVS